MATDVFVDSSGVMTLVYSSDISNNRVVVWVPGQRLAIDVYGPPTFTSSEGGTTRSLMKGPRGIGANTTHIFICDAGNSRIMIFPKTQAQPPHSASDLLGQSSFTATVTLPTTAQTFAFPIAIKFDDAENFYVVDEQLHRVLFFPANTRTATRVYGQPSMVSSGPSAGRNGLNGPRDAVLDEDGNLLVTDSGNNRIMIYAAGSTTAIQGAFFCSSMCCSSLTALCAQWLASRIITQCSPTAGDFLARVACLRRVALRWCHAAPLILRTPSTTGNGCMRARLARHSPFVPLIELSFMGLRESSRLTR